MLLQLDAYMTGVRLAGGKGQMIANKYKEWMSPNDSFVSSIVLLLLAKVFEVFDVHLRADRPCNSLPTLFSEFLKHSYDAFNVETSDMHPKEKKTAISKILSDQDKVYISDMIIFLKDSLLLLPWKGWDVVSLCEKGDISTGATLAHIIVSNVSATILMKIVESIRNFESTDIGNFYKFGPGHDMIQSPSLDSLYQGKNMTPLYSYPMYVQDVLSKESPNRRSLQLEILQVINNEFYAIVTLELAKASLLFDYDQDITIDENITTESSHDSDQEEETKELSGKLIIP
jgi:hypothetical protein